MSSTEKVSELWVCHVSGPGRRYSFSTSPACRANIASILRWVPEIESISRMLPLRTIGATQC
eukprot:575144-Pyramimonas_sp.AAC.1